jgi:hypothetical protein
MRSSVLAVCPWDEKLSTNTWRVIERRTFSNEDLQRLIETLQPTNGLQ